jgi:hypothetical protein
MVSRKFASALSVFICLHQILTAGRAAAQPTGESYLVIEAVGRVIVGQTQVVPGQEIISTAPIRLGEGERLKVLGKGRIISLEGPASATIAPIAESYPASRASISFFEVIGAYLRRVGALAGSRASGPERSQDFSLPRIDVGGSKCVTASPAPRFFVPASLLGKEAFLSHAKSGEAASLGLDTQVISWPSTIPIIDNDRYNLSVAGLSFEWAIHVVAQADIPNEQWVAWMIEKDCTDQVLTYVQNLPPDYVWSAAR